MFIVACVPSTPNAIKQLGLNTWVSSIWSRASSGRGTGQSSSPGTGWTEPKAPGQNQYREIDEESLARLTKDGRTARLQDPDVTWSAPDRDGILRTYHVSTQTEIGEPDAGSDEYQSQHPWVPGGHLAKASPSHAV
ncbi:putative G-protein coupled receptors family 1 profile domain-containing protein [Seiridium cardinale]